MVNVTLVSVDDANVNRVCGRLPLDEVEPFQLCPVFCWNVAQPPFVKTIGGVGFTRLTEEVVSPVALPRLGSYRLHWPPFRSGVYYYKRLRFKSVTGFVTFIFG